MVLLTELLNQVDELPIPSTTLERYISKTANDLARGLTRESKEVLRAVASTKDSSSDFRFFELLRNHYVFAYEYWYDLNPLLGEITL